MRVSDEFWRQIIIISLSLVCHAKTAMSNEHALLNDKKKSYKQKCVFFLSSIACNSRQWSLLEEDVIACIFLLLLWIYAFDVFMVQDARINCITVCESMRVIRVCIVLFCCGRFHWVFLKRRLMSMSNSSFCGLVCCVNSHWNSIHIEIISHINKNLTMITAI